MSRMSRLPRAGYGAAILAAAAAVGLAARPAAASPSSTSPASAGQSATSLSGSWSVGPQASRFAAVKVKRGVRYGGSTSTDDPMVILLSKSGAKVVSVGLSVEANCTSGQYLAFLSTLPASLSISSTGSFTGTRSGTGSPGDGLTSRNSLTLTGKVKGLKATGSLRYHTDIVDGAGATQDTCDSSATFKLASSPGKVFAGVTSQGGPAVIELSSAKDLVHHFHIGWQSHCTPSGVFQVGDTLLNFPVINNKFGASFTSNYSEPTGEKETNAYTVHGKVTPTKASGSMQVKTTDLDAGGATTASCDSGVVSFSALSG